jgi:hypothetical protein
MVLAGINLDVFFERNIIISNMSFELPCGLAIEFGMELEPNQEPLSETEQDVNESRSTELLASSDPPNDDLPSNTGLGYFAFSVQA